MIQFEVLRIGFEPILSTDGSGGFDLKADLSFGDTDRVYFSSDNNSLIRTGVKVAIPKGFVGLLFPRSGKGHKEGMALGNAVGVIDSDYRGEILASIHCNKKGTENPFCNLKHGERFVQLVVVHISTKYEIVDKLDETDRGEGRFGSTGDK